MTTPRTAASDTGSIHEYFAYTEAAIAQAFLAVGLCDDDANHRAATAVLDAAIGGATTGVLHTVS